MAENGNASQQRDDFAQGGTSQQEAFRVVHCT